MIMSCTGALDILEEYKLSSFIYWCLKVISLAFNRLFLMLCLFNDSSGLWLTFYVLNYIYVHALMHAIFPKQFSCFDVFMHPTLLNQFLFFPTIIDSFSSITLAVF